MPTEKDYYPHTKAHYYPITGQLSVRTRNCIRNVFDCREFEDIKPHEIAALTEEQWLQVPNFGRKSLAELKLWLEHFGPSLGQDYKSLVAYRVTIKPDAL